MKQPEPGMRRAFSACVFCLFERKVMLIHHKLLDLWVPVGGELDPGETPSEAAIREVKEETGFDVRLRKRGTPPDGTPDGFLGYEEHAAGPKGWHMNFVFLGDVSSPPGLAPVPKGDGSWSDYRWVPPGDSTFYADLRLPVNVRDYLSLIGTNLRNYY